MKRPWLLPLTPLWAAGAAWKNARFDRTPSLATRLDLPVLSVGSLSAGGAGKTPFVLALGEALRRAGVGFDVLSRGYGRTVEPHLAKRVDPAGTAAEFGDEPLLMAQNLARRVYVAADRAEAGRWAERDRRHLRQDDGPWVHLLDDGFQHRRLLRTIDIVLLTRADTRDTLLPAGDLREPLPSLRRADILVLRTEEAADLRSVIDRIFRNRPRQPAVWEIDRAFRFVQGSPTSSPLAFCGIARPETFRETLAQAKVVPAHFLALRDHRIYDDALVERLLREAQSSRADGFVTTAKDAVKLTPRFRERLRHIGPLAVADVAVHLRHEQAVIADLLQRLENTRSGVAVN